jgi:sugar fermentation stimulation protein A
MGREKNNHRYGQNSRIDLLLSQPSQPLCYVEVKNVSMLLHEGCAAFPDSVTVRGTKHLRELVDMVNQGHRAVMFFLVSRSDAERLVPAEAIDPTYAETLRWAAGAGVELMAHKTKISESGLRLGEALPLHLYA